MFTTRFPEYAPQRLAVKLHIGKVDETGGNSPYTAAILDAAREAPGQNIQQLFPVIREAVHSNTGGMQVPWESSTLVRPFVLAQAVEEAVPVTDSDLPGLSVSSCWQPGAGRASAATSALRGLQMVAA